MTGGFVGSAGENFKGYQEGYHVQGYQVYQGLLV